MIFKEVEKKVGFGLAVVICYPKLSEEFLTKLTFNQWLEVYKTTSLGSDLEATALTQLSELATTFDQWLAIYEVTSPDSDLKDTALTQLSGLVTI